MSAAMRKKTTRPGAWRLTAAAVALGSCLALSVPAGTASAAPADPVPTVFYGDSYTADYGIGPINNENDPRRALCFQAKENHPALATRRLADEGVKLDVQADVSCGGALVENFWEEQTTFPGTDYKVPPQQDALKPDTKLIVGGMGGNTLGFNRILKQCSAKLREPSLLPGEPVDADSPADQCRHFFASADGKQWLDSQFELVAVQLAEMFDRMAYFSPDATRVLVGYSRLVPNDTAKCLVPAPGRTELPLADISQDAMPFLDQVQKRLDQVMKQAAADAGAEFVELYGHTWANTACDGAERGIGGLLEDSQVELFGQKLPWYGHPNERGRDIQAERVADKIEEILNQ